MASLVVSLFEVECLCVSNADSVITFGASTRQYILREKPQPTAADDHRPEDVAKLSGLAKFGLPQEEAALDNLTEFNTAHNKRVAMLTSGEENGASDMVPAKRRRLTGVRFRLVNDIQVSCKVA